jgi:hypothetical protein
MKKIYKVEIQIKSTPQYVEVDDTQDIDLQIRKNLSDAIHQDYLVIGDLFTPEEYLNSHEEVDSFGIILKEEFNINLDEYDQNEQPLDIVYYSKGGELNDLDEWVEENRDNL